MPTLWAVALLLGSGLTLHAQSPFQLGVAGGAAISNLVGDDTEDTDSRTAGYVGGVLVWQPAGMLGFETGVYYVPKGAEADFDGSTGTITLNYVEVPLLLRLALSPARSRLRPFLALGGAVAFKSSCDVEGESGGISVSMDCDEFFTLLADELGVEAETESVDFGLSASVGVDIALGDRAVLSPMARYTRGFTDFLNIDDAAIDAKNSSIQVGVALRLGL